MNSLQIRPELKKAYYSVNIVYIFKFYNFKNILKSSSYKTASSLLQFMYILRAYRAYNDFVRKTLTKKRELY